MNTKASWAKHRLGRILLISLLASTLIWTEEIYRPSGFASNAPTFKSGKTQTMNSPGGEPEALAPEKESTTGTRAVDSDVLDIGGVWKVIQRAPAGFMDSGGHRVPSGTSDWNFKIELTPIGPNSFGGQSFKGRQTDPASPVFFYGDTFYGGVGVQLVQMHSVEDTSIGRFYKLFCGKHQLYERDPKRVEVLGGWAYVGYPAAAGSPPTLSGYDGSFVMVRQ